MEHANILIIEDDSLVAEHLKIHLQHAGHRVIDIVPTGEQAISCVERGGVDLMIVDIVLTGDIDGIDAVQKIHEKYNIPAIYLTAYISDELLNRAERTSPFAYLLKPYRPDELEFIVKMSLARVRIEQELSEQKQLAEAELYQAHAIILHTNEGIMVTDSSSNITSVNPAFTRMTGYSPTEIIGQKTSLLSSGQYGKDFYSAMWASILENGFWQGEMLERHKDGGIFPVWLTINAIYDSDGLLNKYVGIFSDITTIKKSEIEKERLQRELNQIHKMEALGQLTGGIAHDFNNVLAVILGYIDMTLEQYSDELPEKAVDYLEIVKTASERARYLVDQMLTFSRSTTWDKQPLQFAPLIKENVKMLHSILPSSIKVNLAFEDNLPSILLEPAMLQQLVMNLCINAKDAMQGVGTLTINLAWHRSVNAECFCCHKWIGGDWIELSVTDTGSGMTAETLKHLFDPFFTTKDVGKGTGMGMSVIHGIITSHNGHVLVETELGKGTTIRLLFVPVSEESIFPTGIDKKSDELPQGTGQHLLVVDDEPMLAEYISNLLDLHGYQTTVITDSQEALKLFLEDPDKFALLISDQTMPGLTGLALIKRIRDIRPKLPVILCSGFSEDINEDSADNTGVNYLSKPTDANILIQLIGELLK